MSSICNCKHSLQPCSPDLKTHKKRKVLSQKYWKNYKIYAALLKTSECVFLQLHLTCTFKSDGLFDFVQLIDLALVTEGCPICGNGDLFLCSSCKYAILNALTRVILMVKQLFCKRHFDIIQDRSF